MPVRKPSTERQRRLGAELRRMREHVGLSINDAAVLHGTDRTTVSNTESARSGVSSDRVRVWAANYACPDQKYVDALAAMARERGPHWWDKYRGEFGAAFVDLAELEHYATALRHVLVTHLPGLLQHPDYALATFREVVPSLSPKKLELNLEFRQRRRSILERPQPPQCTFVIHEAALRMQFGSRKAFREQLAELLEYADHEAVTILVVPFSVPRLPTVSSSTLYACGPVPQLDTVQVDAPGSMNFLYAETQLLNYRTAVDRMEERALSPQQSQEFIGAVLRES